MLPLSKRSLTYALTTWSILGIVFLLYRAFSYLTWQGFVTPGEISMASVAWLLYSDHPLYTALDAAERYSLQHGPLVYLLIGGIIKLFGPSFFTAKLSGILALLGSLVVSWFWFRSFLSIRAALLLLGLECWLLVKWYFVFLNRPDSLIFLTTATALYFATVTRNRAIRIFGLSVALGLLLNLKVHGLFYALPILILFYKRFGTHDTLLASSGITLIALLPFVHPNISLVNYITWLTNSVTHGISPQILVGNLCMLLLLWVIPLAMALYNRQSLPAIFREHRLLLATTVLSMLIVSIIGAKNGSGSHHLLGFIPLILYSIIPFIKQSVSPMIENITSCSIPPRSAKILLVIILLFVTLGGYNGQARLAKHMDSYNMPECMQREVLSLWKKYQPKTIIIGLGEGSTYQFHSQLNPLLVYAGNPYLLDGCAISDMKASGLSIPASTVTNIKRGTTKVWLIPRGERPFSIGCWYNGSPIFDESFRHEFASRYHLVESTNYFDVWEYSDTQI